MTQNQTKLKLSFKKYKTMKKELSKIAQDLLLCLFLVSGCVFDERMNLTSLNARNVEELILVRINKTI